MASRDDVIAPDGRCQDPRGVFETPFKLGDLVVDRDDDAHNDLTETPSAALVVRAGRAVIDAVVLKDGRTVADVNPDYPRNDPVVEVVFLPTLNRTVPDWKDDWERWQLAWRIADFEEKWGVPVKTYDYPASRLQRAADAGLTEADTDGVIVAAVDE